MSGATQKPLRLLIAALGGEGGGVLAGWVTEAAVASGLVASRTSIPGVAQRTGATTYYIEMVAPADASAPQQARPVLALNPAPGQVDVLLASELLEATLLATTGMLSPDRTTLIANTARVFTMDEKMAMADGRVDPARLEAVLRGAAKRAFILDLAAVAQSVKAPLSAVMLGALAGANVLPITDEAFKNAIRREGKSVDANMAGFAAGVMAVKGAGQPVLPSQPVAPPVPSARAIADLPPRTGIMAAEGVARLTDYQDKAYAETYIERIRRLAAVPGASDAILADVARLLALRMSVEDVIRVAELKLRAARIERVTGEARARPGDIVDITEFLKPGPDEILGLAPPWLGRPLLALVKRLAWAKVALPMTVRTTRASGFIRLKLLAGLKRWRPWSLKSAEEQAWIERWLALVEAALGRDPAAAQQIALSAGLVRGYGDTYARGQKNWAAIMDQIVQPVLAGGKAPADWSDRLLQARLAAEKDPEGQTLSAALAAMAKADGGAAQRFDQGAVRSA